MTSFAINMRIARNYFAPARRFFEWFLSRFKPLTVHTETIFLDSVWEEAKKRAKSNKVHTWYLMTPFNYDYFKGEFNLKLSKKEFSDILLKRYKWLLKKNQRLELHVHLSVLMENMSYLEQETLILSSKKWLENSLGIEIKQFVPGWWIYDENTKKILKKANLKLITKTDYDSVHDYDWRS